jgi:hypothetical protein
MEMTDPNTPKAEPSSNSHLHSEAVVDVCGGCGRCQRHGVTIIVFSAPPPVGVEKNLCTWFCFISGLVSTLKAREVTHHVGKPHFRDVCCCHGILDRKQPRLQAANSLQITPEKAKHGTSNPNPQRTKETFS